MRILPLICFLLLTACKSTIPSESISQGVINDLKAHEKAIQTLEKQTTKECKTDVFLSTLNALKQQTESIEGQVKSINQACQTEKRVLEHEKTIREIIIMVLIGVLCLCGYLFIRRK
jgi:cell division ATPase FtsA